MGNNNNNNNNRVARGKMGHQSIAGVWGTSYQKAPPRPSIHLPLSECVLGGGELVA
jgi:hypothetical protein